MSVSNSAWRADDLVQVAIEISTVKALDVSWTAAGMENRS